MARSGGFSRPPSGPITWAEVVTGMTKRVTRRLATVLGMAVTLVLLHGTPAPAAIAGDAQAESAFTSHVNQERAGRGIGTLRVAADLVDVARRHSAEMAARGQLYHNP